MKKIILLLNVILYSSLSFSQSKSNPNIILILTDDQGWGATSVLMDPHILKSKSDFIQTPNLEKLASRGIVFSNAYAAHPNCSPTRASILTGKSPAKLHFTDIIGRNSGPFYEGNKLIPPQHIEGLPSQETTIAELIKSKRQEYATAHFGKWHLGNGGPQNHGFDSSDGETGNREGNLKLEGNPKDVFGITNRAINWMETQVKEDKPFYLQLSHYATHLGIESKPETLERIKERQPGERHNNITFAGMAEDLDESLGLLLDKLRTLGIEDNTYIIYTSDNGSYPLNTPQNTNGPLHGWKATVWEGGIKVPLLIAGPNIKPGYVKENVVSYDFFPTVSDWLNISDLPDGIEGGSLVSSLKNPEGKNNIKRENDFLVFHFPHYQLQKGTQPATAIINGNYKLIKFYENQSVHLYNLNQDISESKNLAQQKPEVVKKLLGDLENYLAEIDAGLPVQNKSYSEAEDPGRKTRWIKEKLMQDPYFLLQKN